MSWQAYRLKANENIANVASRYGMSLETLRAVNGIGSRARVPAGHMLLVPAERPSPETVEALDAGRCSPRSPRAARSTTP